MNLRWDAGGRSADGPGGGGGGAGSAGSAGSAGVGGRKRAGRGRLGTLLVEHGADAALRRLRREEVADDVHGGLVAGGGALFGQFDHRRRGALHLAHVLAALADDAPHLRVRNGRSKRDTRLQRLFLFCKAFSCPSGVALSWRH